MAAWNFGRDVMDRWAAERPDAAALYVVAPDGSARTVSFRAFSETTGRLAGRLRAAGLRPGDRVLVVLGKDPGFWSAMVALIKLGVVPMPGTTQLTAKDLQYRLEAAEATGMIALAEVAARVSEEVAGRLRLRWTVGGPPPAGWVAADLWPAEGPIDPGHPTDETDPCLIYFTSGTTGYPKMVLHQQSYPRGHRITGVEWIGLQPGDLHWNLSDTGWAKAAWSSLFGPWMAGATILVDPLVGKFEARPMLDLLAAHPVTSLCAAPTVYRLVVQEDLAQWRFPHLRSAVGAGEPLNPEVIEAFRRGTGLTIRDGYGQTETVLLVGNRPGMPVKPGAMGVPAPGFDVDVIDEEGQRMPPGREGDIAVWVGDGRPEGLFVEYWKDPAETARRHRGGWYLTGDRAVRDEDGYLWFVGRADDVIISAGYRIGPFEVESALVEHPAVVEAAVVSSPDPVRGAIVKAFVVLRPDVSPSAELVRDLQEHVRRVTAPYKYPRAIEFVSDLPKTISGKIRRVELREREWGGRPGGGPTTG
jgi:acyl-coenzyme A synthetase/AMP-(fatty) acid ligase